MECADGQKGGKDLICPDLDSVAVKKLALNADIAVKEKERAKAEEAMKDAEDDLAKAQAVTDSAAAVPADSTVAAPVPKKTDDEIAEAIERGKKALAAKLEAQKALEAAEKALAEAKKAEREALKAEQAALRAERQAMKAEKRRLAQEKKAKAREQKRAAKKAAKKKK